MISSVVEPPKTAILISRRSSAAASVRLRDLRRIHISSIEQETRLSMIHVKLPQVCLDAGGEHVTKVCGMEHYSLLPISLDWQVILRYPKRLESLDCWDQGAPGLRGKET